MSHVLSEFDHSDVVQNSSDLCIKISEIGHCCCNSEHTYEQCLHELYLCVVSCWVWHDTSLGLSDLFGTSGAKPWSYLTHFWARFGGCRSLYPHTVHTRRNCWVWHNTSWRGIEARRAHNLVWIDTQISLPWANFWPAPSFSLSVMDQLRKLKW